ncbi:MAG: sigma-54-dependent Fis family transcriptional regulator [Deltaproteobacteria bacterium]|nr:sigma-54-dependent Fis family transcriptional regulator [Deltaproteobacteria bacterium]
MESQPSNTARVNPAGRLLIVDDQSAHRRALQRALQGFGFEVIDVVSVSEATARLEVERFDAVVTDLHLGEEDGLVLCRWVVSNLPQLPVIVITGFGTIEAAVAALRVGAYDFLQKPFDPEQLRLTLARAIRHGSRRGEAPKDTPVGAVEMFDELVGESAAVVRLRDTVSRVAASNTTILVTGESGTGKELAARAIHRASGRAGRFVAVNCAAMPETLLESELFGHVRGAFTDAKAVRRGLFLEANGGTLFLDEIGELPLTMQPKLLRALQERIVRPVGSDVEQPHQARIVAATNRDLEAEVSERRFREDLYYRINVVRIEVPPLRARGDDVVRLAREFLRRSAIETGKPVTSLAPEVEAKLGAYPWPGNVRELQNCMERAVTFARGESVAIEDLPERIAEYQARPEDRAPSGEVVLSMEEVERRHILFVLERVGGNKSLAATKLGMDRRTLHRKLESYGLKA